ncbi:ABC transporter substrate-binding protein [Maridesulfovibrio sp.]|uniref:ABC transporter substrate-binding protein n=1 Tax=unclassified Maridesulfovibrio TaxID=2794999 RepID=UPI003AFF8F16
MLLNCRLSLKIFLLSLCLVAGLGSAVLAAEKVLNVAGPWGPKTLDIQKTGYVFKRLGVTESLIEVGQDLELKPGLAESWTVSPDKTTWTFTIRKGVKFHDGTALKAGAIKSCLERLQSKGSLFKAVPLKSITAPDDRTLVLTTSEPFAPLGAYLSMGETSPLAPSSFDSSGEVVNPVGTGPFAFESWKVKDHVVVKRNPIYWGEKAKVSKVVYRGVPNAITRLGLLRAGELDIAMILPPDAVASLQKSDKYQVFRTPIGRCRMVALNMAEGPFSDLQVRKAANMAVNRDDLVRYVLEGMGDSATTLYPPMIYWANDKIKGFHFDQAGAKKLLEQAGWKDADGDGIREKNGKPLKVKLVTYPERAALPPTAEVMQAQLREVGFDVELVVTQVDAAQALRSKGDFDMFLVGRGLLFVPDPDYNLMKDYYSVNTAKDSGWGAYRFSNAKVDELLFEGRKVFKQSERKAIYDQVQTLLMEEVPMMYLNYYVNVDAVAKDVEGYTMHPTESSYHLETVTLNR